MQNIRLAAKLCTMLVIALSASALLSFTGLAGAQKAKPRQPVISTTPQSTQQLVVPLTLPANSTLTVTPAPSISANNPGSVISSSAVAVTFYDNGTNGGTNKYYYISVWATGGSGTNFAGTGCPSVPISAITASCKAGTAPTGGTVACASGSFTLPTTQPAITSSNLVNRGTVGSAKGNYTLTVTYSLTDNYQYYATTGQPCTVTLNYSVQAQSN